jgi:ParB-like chromosome segregation protein Spo0J
MKVCFDGEKYWLFDGYHRLEAMKSLGFNRCDVIINRGDRRDALRRYINDKLKGKKTFGQSKVF